MNQSCARFNLSGADLLGVLERSFQLGGFVFLETNQGQEKVNAEYRIK